MGLQVQQYSALSAFFKRLLQRGGIDGNFHMALTQNQGRFLEALRLFIELGIPDNAVDGEKGQSGTAAVCLRPALAQGNPLFAFPPTPNREKLKGIFVELAQKEAQDCTGTAEEKEGCRRAVEINRPGALRRLCGAWGTQFSPVQIRLLAEMEKLGFTVIFLFSYQKEYAEMYASWREIYSCFEAPVHHDTAVPSYRPPAGQNPSHALACALGALCKGRQAGDAAQLRRWYQGYKDVPFVQFANVTEYAHFISRHFDAAVQKIRRVRGGPEQGGVWSNAAVLRHMDEQVYTANRDVHALLRIYYPAYAGERHFLSYPIGQFFSAIYRLWDYARGEIRFDIPAVKECLSSGILRAAPGENLLRAFCHGESSLPASRPMRTSAGRWRSRTRKITKKSSRRSRAIPLPPAAAGYLQPGYPVQKGRWDFDKGHRGNQRHRQVSFRLRQFPEDFIDFGSILKSWRPF